MDPTSFNVTDEFYNYIADYYKSKGITKTQMAAVLIRFMREEKEKHRGNEQVDVCPSLSTIEDQIAPILGRESCETIANGPARRFGRSNTEALSLSVVSSKTCTNSSSVNVESLETFTKTESQYGPNVLDWNGKRKMQ